MRLIGTLMLTMVCLLPWPALAEEEVERFTDGDAIRGAKLHKQYCRGCHGVDGRGGAHTFMPHIENLTKKEHIEFIPDGFFV